jgi:hypothetical protein
MAVVFVTGLFAGCTFTPTRSQTCDKATVVVVICTLARCDVPKVEGAKEVTPPPECPKK